MFFDEIFVMTRFWISFFFFIVTSFHLLDRKTFEMSNFFFFFFSLQNAFYKLMMLSKLFKHFRFRSNCRKNDVDIDIKFVIN
jgi:hypothetical protein